MTKIEIDIKRYLKEYLLDILDKDNLEKEYLIYIDDKTSNQIKTMDLEELLHIFFNLKSRLIKKQKYKVYFSKELYNNPLYNNFASRIRKLKKFLESGKNIREYLSTSINDILNTSDPLLQDWGVHHLHFEKSLYYGQRKRTNAILFVMIIERNAYFIDIFNHKDWFNLNALEIVHRNWVNALDGYKLVGITPDILTEENFKNLRKNDVGYAIGLNGSNEAYAPTLNPYSRLRNIQNTITITHTINHIEKCIQENKEKIFKETISITGTDLDSINLKVYIDKQNRIVQYYDDSISTGFNIDNNMLQEILIKFEIL